MNSDGIFPTVFLPLYSFLTTFAMEYSDKKTMKRLHLYIITLFSALLCSLHSDAAPAHSRSITIYEGLAGESVYAIYRDADELTWFGTINGITCYDGYSLTTYNVNKQRSKNAVNGFATTADGKFYAAASSGLYVRSDETGLFCLVDNGLTDKITAITAHGNTIYAGTVNGLYIRENKRTKHIWPTTNHLSRNNMVEDIKVTNDGKVWVLCTNELYVLNSRSGKLTPVGLQRMADAPTDCKRMEMAKGRVFLGTYNSGLFCYDSGHRRIYKYTDVGCNVITCLNMYNGLLYVGTDGAGLSVISPKSDEIVKTYSSDPGSEIRLLDNTVYSFMRDKNGVCFFGYFRRGVHHTYFTTPLFHCYKTQGFNSSGINVRSFWLDGKIKVLGLRGGLYLINEATGKHKFFTPAELGGSIVTNVVKYDGDYYCCTFNGGVMRIDPKTLTTSRFGKSEILRRGSFGTLVVSPDNELWMGGNYGVIVYNGTTGSERIYDDHNSQMYRAYCNNLMFDSQGRCWISSSKGICLYDPIDKTIHNSGFPDKFFNKAFETVGERGDNGNLLFSCIDGLYRTNEELTEFGQIDLTQTIGNDYISQVVYDHRHRNYWVGTERGLFRFDTSFKHVAKYAQEVGLDSREFSTGAIFIDRENRLWTGTVDGLYYADLDDLQKYKPQNNLIAMTDVRTGTEHISLHSKQSLLRHKSIRLTYNWGVQTLSFLPIMQNYSDPDGQCFEYRVNDGEWVVLKNRERARITDAFSIGGNTLQIRLAGQKEGTIFHVSVWPSWIWIVEIIAGVAFIASLLILLNLRRINRRQKKEMVLVQQELEETKRKYSRVTTSDSEQKELYKRLRALMEEKKLYLNQELKLSDLATQLEVSTVKLSQLFNVYAETNYYDFVNKYRLEEFKQRLNSGEYANITLMALAESCGFKRSSFFSTFKKVEGTTPLEYAKKVGKGVKN